jgi:hypothetical protein
MNTRIVKGETAAPRATRLGTLAARRAPRSSKRPLHGGAVRCRRKFLRWFPDGFRDADYLDFERDYKWQTHEAWERSLPRGEFGALIRAKEFDEIAARALRVEQSARHSLMFSFEKMALRDAVRARTGARAFSEGLYDFLHGRAGLERRFERWVSVVAELPRKQTRVLTWPLVTVFGFVAQPDTHMFMKPNVMRAAAREYGFPLAYASRPSWENYASLLELAATVRRDLHALKPRDMIDLQSFLWVQGSDEYEE